MNKPSVEELKKYDAYYEPDTEFQAKARYLQSKWLKAKGIEKGRSQRNKGDYYGNFINEKDAEEKGCNFLTQKIWGIAQEEMENAKKEKKQVRPVYNDYQFVCNLLRSQALCFNLFAEFLDREYILVKVFNELKPNLMDRITKIKFEYSPGRQDKKYTNDGTAFDVFIEYEKNNERSFLGIEVKYSEDLKDEEVKTAEDNFENNTRLKKITEDCGLFKPDVIDGIKGYCGRGTGHRIIRPPYSQIWRDHLLSISLKSAQNYINGYYVFLYPSNNPECHCGIKKYMEFLQNPEESIFELHLEDFINCIKKYITEPWANELFHRYIEGL